MNKRLLGTTPYVEIFSNKKIKKNKKKKKKKKKQKNKNGVGTSNFVLFFFSCTKESQPCSGHIPIK